MLFQAFLGCLFFMCDHLDKSKIRVPFECLFGSNLSVAGKQRIDHKSVKHHYFFIPLPLLYSIIKESLSVEDFVY